MLIDLQQSVIVQIVYQYTLKDVVTITTEICEEDLVKTSVEHHTARPLAQPFSPSHNPRPCHKYSLLHTTSFSLVPLYKSQASSHILPLVTSF